MVLGEQILEARVASVKCFQKIDIIIITQLLLLSKTSAVRQVNVLHKACKQIVAYLSAEASKICGGHLASSLTYMLRPHDFGLHCKIKRGVAHWVCHPKINNIVYPCDQVELPQSHCRILNS